MQPIKLKNMKSMNRAWTPKQPVWFQKNKDFKSMADAEMDARTAEQHASRLRQLFPKMEREDAERLGRELSE